ncbi:hypothetical protein HHI36_007561 [Cryptolaemus montrouzieri]|uniref:Uncharacterized protein n=1 Tax=Cryptolaemus montrouzieri TaxID=559131 RepID=A0ABD2MPZ2_9CUCU
MARYYNTISDLPEGQLGKHNFTTLYLNAQLIRNKMANIEVLLGATEPDIVVISETWLAQEEDKYFEFLGYDSVCQSEVTFGSSTLIDCAFTNSGLNSQLAIFHGYVADHRHQILYVDSPQRSKPGEPSDSCLVYDVDKPAFQEKLNDIENKNWCDPDEMCNDIIRAYTCSPRKKY